jgi:hypothetical protein
MMAHIIIAPKSTSNAGTPIMIPMIASVGNGVPGSAPGRLL